MTMLTLSRSVMPPHHLPRRAPRSTGDLDQDERSPPDANARHVPCSTAPVDIDQQVRGPMDDGDPGIVSRHAVSTGHILATGAWLDTHFEACRSEYEAMLESVGIAAGWFVLDAGCG